MNINKKWAYYYYATMTHSGFSLLDVWISTSPRSAQGSNTDCLLKKSAFCMKNVLMSEYESAPLSLLERANGQCPGEGDEGNGKKGELASRRVSDVIDVTTMG